MESIDNEILNDFIIETREIINELQEQLIVLESEPQNSDLLNAIFRGFHTIKGGAGFLELTALVETCHTCENIFDELRKGSFIANSDTMDTILKGFDEINRMFNEVEEREPITPAPQAILDELKQCCDNKGKAAASSSDMISEQDFNAIMKEIPDVNTPSMSALEMAQNNPSDEITEEEFEALLAELHGSSSQSNNVITKQEIVPVEATKDEPTKKTQKANHGESTVRVDTVRLDEIMNMVGEMVLVRNRLISMVSSKENLNFEELATTIANLDLVTGDLQNSVVKTRMQPIKKVFGRFPRLVRDLAKNLKKEIKLELVGEETELDKNLVEALADPLIHMVRNSVDHGIESPSERMDAGKPSLGTITLSADQEGDHILLSIQDDGAGMDPNKLKALAVSRGVIDSEQAERMTDSEAFNIIFMPGFSTKTEISDISGRGVGMDVVKTSITQLNGNISIESSKGSGTTVTIRVPLTLAIQPTMMVSSMGQVFALPLSCISEIYQFDINNTNCIGGQLTTNVRGKTVRLIYLDRWIKKESQREASGSGTVVLVKVGTTEVAIVVDSVIGQEEVVIKPLGAFLSGVDGVVGATITSDGGIALIMDMTDLLKMYGVGK